MTRSGIIGIAATMLVAVSSAFAQAPQPDTAQGNPELTVAAIRLGVTDFDQSIDFYSAHLGCKLAAEHRDAGYVILTLNDVLLVMTKAQAPVEIPVDACHTRINFAVDDLDASIKAMKAAGVKFVDEGRSAVGRYATFLDPSGNRHNIKQLDQPDPEQLTPGIYDVGIAVSDVADARKFYAQTLGFEVLTEKYYPPVVPFKQRGSTFFILSETAKKPAVYEHGVAAMTGLAFACSDIEIAIQRLRVAGVKLCAEKPAQSGNVLHIGFQDPFGNVHEVIQHVRQDQPSADTHHQAAPPSAVDGNLQDLAWMTGTWLLTREGERLEETWSVPAGDSLVGAFRWLRNDEHWLYELMTISQENHTLVFRLRHFDPSLAPLEKNEPLTYWLARMGPNEVAFEDPDSTPDHPRRFVYQRNGRRLAVRLESADPAAKADEFVFELTGNALK